MMKETNWEEFRESLNLTPEEENAIEVEKSLIRARLWECGNRKD